MKNVDVQRLYSWLQYLDIEYLDDDLAHELAGFDINDTQQQVVVIKRAIAPEFELLNEKSKKSLKEILAECANLPDDELEKVFSRVGMPFNNKLIHRSAFLREIRKLLFAN